MKISKLFLFLAIALALVACSTIPLAPQESSSAGAAQARSPSLPFGDMRVVSPARLDQSPTPEFMPSPFELSAELAKRKISGEATIGFTISPRGKPEQIRVLRTTDPQLGQLAASYVGRLVFRPARLGGSAVACEMEMPFSRK